MLLNLTDVFTSEGKVKELSVPYEEKTFSYMGNEYEIKGDTVADMKLSNIGTGTVLVEGSVTALMIIPCDRCLEEVSTEIPLEIERKLDMKLTDEDRVNDLDESSYLTGMDLDVDRLVYLEVLMSWPLKVLCREDCKGICSQCGKNLNDGPCGCVEEPKDPRMAAISDIFSKFKEV